MTLVTIDSSILDQTTMLALVGMAAIFVVIVLLIYVFYNRYRTPKEAADVKRASNRGQMLLLLAGVDKYADTLPMHDLIPEGVKESEPQGKGAKKVSLRYTLPKAATVPSDIEVAAGKDKAKTVKVLQAVLNANTDTVFLRKAKIPVLVGVKNSVAAVSFKFLGLQAFLSKLERIQKNGDLYKQIDTLKSTKQFRELALWLEDLSTNITVIDFQQVYARAASIVGQTEMDSISERDQTIGRREGKEDKDKGTKTLLLYFGFAMCGLAAVIAVIYFFGGK